MGRIRPGHYGATWEPPGYTVDQHHRVVGVVPPEPNNWRRWGEDDQRGTANLITPETIVLAASLIVEGLVVSLAIPIDSRVPVHATRPSAVHTYVFAGSDYIVGSPTNERFNPGLQWTDDCLFTALHGSTHWDGLAHIGRDDVLYNGFWCGAVTAAGGAARNGIEHQAESFVGRGVLLDLCRDAGRRSLQRGDVITEEMLDHVATSQGVEIRAGDMVLVRTGYLRLWYELDRASPDFPLRAQEWWSGEPGLGLGGLEWCRRGNIAAVAADNWAVEVFPTESADGGPSPIHEVGIQGLGLTLGEFWWLEDLATMCAERGRWDFFLAAQPLRVASGSGSILNPVAIF